MSLKPTSSVFDCWGELCKMLSLPAVSCLFQLSVRSMMIKPRWAIKQSQPNQSQIVCSTMHFMGICRELRCVIKQGFGGRSPPRQKQNKIDYYNKNKQCADRRVDLYERNTKWPSRRQLSTTCLSPLCST